jgi:PAS domain-containing protein
MFWANMKKQEKSSLSGHSALDALHANVMMVDENLIITYMNPAVKALMREAETDLRRELPNFNAQRLVGGSVDQFHKHPEHQRRILRDLRAPHRAAICVGERVFDMAVTPLFVDGRREGFVVEWADARERLKNDHYAEQIKALHRSSAAVEFSADGIVLDANHNFLTLLGYGLDEIKGKHHRIFLDPAEAGSPEYASFWQRWRGARSIPANSAA